MSSPKRTGWFFRDKCHSQTWNNVTSAEEKARPTDNTDGLIEALAKRADSILLWAELMVKYLHSSFLTPTKRVGIIEKEKPFEGLDNLFGKILVDLGKRAPEIQHEKVRKLCREWEGGLAPTTAMF